ncbi:esterase B1-like, partial [Hermetia illucens]
LLSYKYFWHGLHRTLLSRAKYAKAPTFLYRFDFDSPTFNHARIICCGKRRRGVSHADDLSYLFYNAIAHDLRPGSAEYKTIKSLVGMWTQFAETGDPNIESVTTNAWQPIRNDETFKCLNISYKISFIDLPESKSLEVWDSLYEDDLI